MQGLREAIRLFLIQQIASVERLDILLFMTRHADKWWTARAIGDELRITVESAQLHLDALGRLNVLAVRIAQDVLYRYNPAQDRMNDMIQAIAAANYADRDGLVGLMAYGLRNEVRLFADAFKLRKGPDDV